MATRRELVEKAKDRGINMSWLGTAPAVQQARVEQSVQGHTQPIPRRPADISPEARILVDAIRKRQTERPAYLPFAPGTPTQQRRQAEEQRQLQRERDLVAQQQWQMAHDVGRQQWQMAHDVGRQQWGARHSLSERKFAADEAHRAAQAALARETALFGATLTERENMALANAHTQIGSLVQQAVKGGEKWHTIQNVLFEKKPEFIRVGVPLNQIDQIAFNHYKRAIGDRLFMQSIPLSILEKTTGAMSPSTMLQINSFLNDLEQVEKTFFPQEGDLDERLRRFQEGR